MMTIGDGEFVVLDTETTGLSLTDDRIIEFGAATFAGGEMKAAGAARFNPGVPIPKAASDVHGITDDMLVGKESFASRVERIRGHCEKMPLIVGFNCRRFDVPLIDAECARVPTDWRVPAHKVLDVKSFVDWHHRGERKRTQEAMAALYAIDPPGRLHSAAADAHLTGLLLLAMVNARLIPNDADEALAEDRRLAALVDAEFEKWSYWVYEDRKTHRLRMGAGANCGTYLSDLGAKVSWHLNNVKDLPADARRVFEDARAGRIQNELQSSMVDDQRPKVDVKWGGW